MKLVYSAKVIASWFDSKLNLNNTTVTRYSIHEIHGRYIMTMEYNSLWRGDCKPILSFKLKSVYHDRKLAERTANHLLFSTWDSNEKARIVREV